MLKNNGITGSMGRVGACGDNAGMESFFALLQKNVLDRHRWTTQEELRLAIVVWIEKTYHRKRRQRRLGKLTPIELETINIAPSTPHKTTNPPSQLNSGQSPTEFVHPVLTFQGTAMGKVNEPAKTSAAPGADAKV